MVNHTGSRITTRNVAELRQLEKENFLRREALRAVPVSERSAIQQAQLESLRQQRDDIRRILQDLGAVRRETVSQERERQEGVQTESLLGRGIVVSRSGGSSEQAKQRTRALRAIEQLNPTPSQIRAASNIVRGTTGSENLADALSFIISEQRTQQQARLELERAKQRAQEIQEKFPISQDTRFFVTRTGGAIRVRPGQRVPEDVLRLTTERQFQQIVARRAAITEFQRREERGQLALQQATLQEEGIAPTGRQIGITSSGVTFDVPASATVSLSGFTQFSGRPFGETETAGEIITRARANVIRGRAGDVLVPLQGPSVPLTEPLVIDPGFSQLSRQARATEQREFERQQQLREGLLSEAATADVVSAIETPERLGDQPLLFGGFNLQLALQPSVLRARRRTQLVRDLSTELGLQAGFERERGRPLQAQTFETFRLLTRAGANLSDVLISTSQIPVTLPLFFRQIQPQIVPFGRRLPGLAFGAATTGALATSQFIREPPTAGEIARFTSQQIRDPITTEQIFGLVPEGIRTRIRQDPLGELAGASGTLAGSAITFQLAKTVVGAPLRGVGAVTRAGASRVRADVIVTRLSPASLAKTGPVNITARAVVGVKVRGGLILGKGFDVAGRSLLVPIRGGLSGEQQRLIGLVATARRSVLAQTLRLNRPAQKLALEIQQLIKETGGRVTVLSTGVTKDITRLKIPSPITQKQLTRLGVVLSDIRGQGFRQIQSFAFRTTRIEQGIITQAQGTAERLGGFLGNIASPAAITRATLKLPRVNIGGTFSRFLTQKITIPRGVRFTPGGLRLESPTFVGGEVGGRLGFFVRTQTRARVAGELTRQPIFGPGAPTPKLIGLPAGPIGADVPVRALRAGVTAPRGLPRTFQITTGGTLQLPGIGVSVVPTVQSLQPGASFSLQKFLGVGIPRRLLSNKSGQLILGGKLQPPPIQTQVPIRGLGGLSRAQSNQIGGLAAIEKDIASALEAQRRGELLAQALRFERAAVNVERITPSLGVGFIRRTTTGDVGAFRIDTRAGIRSELRPVSDTRIRSATSPLTRGRIRPLLGSGTSPDIITETRQRQPTIVGPITRLRVPVVTDTITPLRPVVPPVAPPSPTPPPPPPTPPPFIFSLPDVPIRRQPKEIVPRVVVERFVPSFAAVALQVRGEPQPLFGRGAFGTFTGLASIQARPLPRRGTKRKRGLFDL